jgi:lactoylglutathione lyase
MIRVLDEDRSVAFYERAFGLKVAERLPFDDFTLVYMSGPENDFELELTINRDQEKPYTHGDAYGHMAVTVDNVDAEQQRFKALDYGPTDVMELRVEQTLLARFFFVRDPDGYQIEVLQRHGRYK